MAAVTQVRWDPNPLNRALLGAFKPSVFRAKDYAKATSPSSKAGVTIKRLNATSLQTAAADLVPTGLGWVFEKGRVGGYPIFPGGAAGFRKSRAKSASIMFNSTGRTYTYRKGRGSSGALKFSRGDGGFAAYAVGGKMKPDQYINPASSEWSRVIYPRQAASYLRSAGFGPGNVR